MELFRQLEVHPKMESNEDIEQRMIDDMKADLREMKEAVKELTRQMNGETGYPGAANTYGHEQGSYNSHRGHSGFQRPERDHSGRGSMHRQSDRSEVVCYRCGQPGHLRVGCRARVDHLREGFYRGSTVRGNRGTYHH